MMTVATDAWISEDTEQKEADFRGLLDMHARVCRAITARYGGQPYLYVDLYAGPGRLDFEGRKFDGSPLIARDALAAVGLPYRGVHFDCDLEVAGRLRDALGRGAEVYATACQDGFPDWLATQPRQTQRLGLIYSDPIKDEIPHELLNAAALKFPKVDLLSYVSATQYKRRRGSGPEWPYLADHIAAVDKRVVLIREPLGKWQWTFILWTNWADMKEWRRRGFYRLDSPDGERVLERLNLSRRESHEAANTPLPLFGEA